MVYYRDAQGNKYNMMTVKELQRAIRNEPDNYLEVTNDFEKHLGVAEPEEYYYKVKKFVLDSIAHMPDVKAYYCFSLCKTYLFAPNDPYVLGVLGVDKSGDYTYSTESHLVVNNRYCAFNSPTEHRTVQSNRYVKGLTNSRRYLRTNTLADVVRCTYDRLESRFNVICDEQRTKVNDLLKSMGAGKVLYGRTDLTTETPILAEMMRMQDMGVKFLDNNLDAQLTDYREHLGLLVEVGNQNEMIACFVREDHRGNTVVDHHDIKIQAPYSFPDDSPQNPYNPRYLTEGSYNIPVDKLYEDIGNKMASLSIVDDGTFVRGVGYKYSENVYYVIK